MSGEKTFYLVGGPNGSGKTTFVRQILSTKGIDVLDADNVAAIKQISNIDAARQLLNEDLPHMLKSGRSFVLESTLSGTYDTRVVKMARDLKYYVNFIFMFLDSVEQNIERVAKRVRAGGHNVDADIIRRRYEKSLHNFHKLIPLVDAWHLYYNGNEGVACNVANGTSMTIDIKNKEYYGVFCDNCFDASVRRMMHFIEIGASNARLAAEGIGTNIPFGIIEQLIKGRQR